MTNLDLFVNDINRLYRNVRLPFHKVTKIPISEDDAMVRFHSATIDGRDLVLSPLEAKVLTLGFICELSTGSKDDITYDGDLTETIDQTIHSCQKEVMHELLNRTNELPTESSENNSENLP